ncbi:MAG TPA: gfo/Idh/MocA family oxidoreductase, partial [Chitinophagaceae bacterium]|nr:gfo/Idh/MocA family oxidoreductase [Chitinophagaceae bacterium]
SAKQKEEFKKWYNAEYSGAKGGTETGKPIEFKPPANYDDRLDHFINFFNGIRTGSAIMEDAVFGLRAAGPSIACNISAAQQKPLNWDATKMKIV